MDVLLYSLEKVIPVKSREDFRLLLTKLENACLRPSEVMTIFEKITTNQYVIQILTLPIDDKEKKKIKINIFKDIRKVLDKEVFSKISPLLHIFIGKFIDNLEPSNNLGKILLLRHSTIIKKANELKQNPEFESYDDLGIWLVAEKEVNKFDSYLKSEDLNGISKHFKKSIV